MIPKGYHTSCAAHEQCLHMIGREYGVHDPMASHMLSTCQKMAKKTERGEGRGGEATFQRNGIIEERPWNKSTASSSEQGSEEKETVDGEKIKTRNRKSSYRIKPVESTRNA